MVFGLITFLLTLLGGLFAVRLRERIGVLAAFAAGVLISVPLFDLLPEAIDIALRVEVPIENLMYTMALGFIFLYVLERYISLHKACERDGCENVRHQRSGLVGSVELSIHSYMDGFAIGVGFQVNFHVGLIVAIAVISHDFSDGLNTVTIMLSSGNSLRSSIGMLLLDATTPVIGVISTLFFRIPERYLTLFLPFFAGGFLYLGASDLLPEAHKRASPPVSLASSLIGFFLIFLVTRMLNVGR